MARLIAVLVILLMLAPVTMAEPSSHGVVDFDWIGGLWHRLMGWVSRIGACVIPDGFQAEPLGVGAHMIPDGLQAEPLGVGGYVIPNG